MKSVITPNHVNLRNRTYRLLMSFAFSVGCILVNTCVYSQAVVASPAIHTSHNGEPDIESILHYYDHQVFFVENKGQWESAGLYRADFPLGQALATKEGMLLATFDAGDMQAAHEWSLKEEEARKNLQEFTEPPVKIHGHGWQMQFLNASDAMTIQAKHVHDDVFNYFMGDSPGQTNVKSYQEIWYNNVYDHVDVRYYPSEEGSLEYDIICKPGFDTSQLAIRMEGIDRIEKMDDGSLIFQTSVGKMQIPAPVVYQVVDGKKIIIEAEYTIYAHNIVSFKIGDFNKRETLVIDPIAMRWATWVNSNSSGQNHGHCIWVDQTDGAIYIVARVDGSTNFITAGAFDITSNGHIDLVIGKYLEPDDIGGAGTRVWQTYVGGSLDDNPYAMEQGPDGNLYISGYTSSPDFPLIGGPDFSGSGIDNRAETTDNIFITKINTSGNSIKSAVIGGNNDDGAFDLRIAADGDILVCGNTQSTNLDVLFPGSGATNTNFGGIDAIVFKINSNLETMEWIQNYGGSGTDQATIMLVNTDNDDIFVAGYTNSATFPTLSPRQGSKVGGTDGFIQKFGGDGSMLWSSYFNSAMTKTTKILCMEFNADQSELIFGGITNGLHSSNIPASGVYDNTYNGGTNDLFIVNMDTDQTFNCATYIGGSGNEVNMMGMNVDLNNDVFVFGYTDSNSPSLSATFGALQTTNYGVNDKIFFKLSSDLSTLIYLTYYGGSGNDYDPIGQRGIKASNCRIYTIITAQSKDIPLTEGALNTNKISSTSVYEPGLVVWANPPDLINNEILSDQVVCPGETPGELTGSEPEYVLPVIIRDGITSPYPDIGSAEVYQWQYSLDSLTWIDVPGGIFQNLDPALIGPIDTTTYFRRVIGGDVCFSLDADNITVTVSVLNVDGVVTDPLCYGAAEGAITLLPEGSSGYTYEWNTGDETITIDGLSAGDYFAVVSDALGCTDTFFATIVYPDDLVISETHENVNISCGVNGSIDITVSGGSPGYTFLWNDGSTDEDRFDLGEGTYTVIVTDASDCSDTLEIEISFETSLSCIISGDAQFCSGGFTTLSGPEGFEYLWSTGETSQTIDVYSAGLYSLTITDAWDCTATCDLNVVELAEISVDVYTAICEGDILLLPDGTSVSSAGDYTAILTASNGCDSTIITHVSVNPGFSITENVEICEYETYTMPDGSVESDAGIYNYYFSSIAGCDSNITINLSIDYSSSDTVFESICDGEIYILPDGTAVSSTGIYVSIPPVIEGCDSTIVTNLTVHPVYAEVIDAEICDGADYVLPDGSIVTTSGVYITNLSSIEGCDSIITTNLTVRPVYAATVDAEICDGADYILPDGSIATTTGVYITSLLSIEGCDSVITTNLTVHPVYTATFDAEICDGADYILPDGSIVTTSGVYVTSLLSIDGCDSIITTNLIVHPVYTATVDAEICDGADYTLPDGSIATTTGVYITSLLSIEGCDSVITTNLTVHPVYAATVDAEICDGVDYTLPDGSIVTTTGVYVISLSSIDGCDSIITTNLTVHPVYAATVEAEICDGADYILPDGSIATTTGVYVISLSSIEGCDSVITTNLTVHPVYAATIDTEICDGADYILPDGSIVTTTGVYVINLLSIEGCDSIITTNLIVNPVYTATVDAAICEGSDYILPDGSIATTTGVYITSLLSIEGCDSVITTNLTVHPVYTATVDAEICDGAEYILPDGSIATATGVYVISLLSIDGCDSIITTNLTVNPVYAATVDAEICDGADYILPDGSIATTTGVYVISLSSIEGCDSVITTNLTVHPVYYATVDAEICDGAEYILPDGSIATTTGVYVISLSSIEGCDSVITTNLTVHPVYAATVDAEICDGAEYILPDGSIATNTGVYVINLLSIDGCDSIITTNLTVHPVYTATVEAEICEGSDYILPDGSIATTTGVYITNLSSIDGCDSIITTNLTVHPVYTATFDAAICEGSDYILPDGSIATTTGVYVTGLLSIEGCDSVITTNLTVHPVYAATVEAEICDGADYILPDGSIATATGVYITSLLSIEGCDSIITTNLTVHPVYTATVDAEICDGAEYILPDGSIATATGVYITSLSSIEGCDSIITTNLTVNPVYAATVDAEICDGAVYILPDGSIATATGVYITGLLSIDGCDSVITTNLTVHPVYTAIVDAAICEGSDYILPDGSIATATGVYITGLLSIDGCDSVITTNLTLHPVYAATVDAAICEGAEYILPDGSIVTTTGVYVTSLLSIDGCDSIITTYLTVNLVYTATVDAEICEGSDYVLPDGSIVTTSGVYITNLSSIEGCDSIITTNLTVHPVYAATVDAEICDGAEYVLPDGSIATTTGVYVTNLLSIDGCDSIITTNLTVHPVYAATVDAEICDGADYILPDGSIATTTGVYVINLLSIEGCDSIITTNLTVHPVYTATVDAEICDGAEYILPDGSIVTTTGVYVISLLSIEGCDSVITTNLTVHPVYAATVDAEICDGADYILPDGSIATTTGVYVTGLSSIEGCDSVITTNLTVHPVYAATVDAEICDGADYILPDGSIATTTGVYVTSLLSIDGCDSIITTNLTVHPVYTATVDAAICEGAEYILPDGSIATSSGVYVINLLTVNGCDSIITTNLSVGVAYSETIDASICDGEEYILPDGTIATTGGVYITDLPGVDGCDSIITTNLTVHPVYYATVDAEICDGADYILPDGSIATATGVYITGLLSIEGCDSVITTNLTVHPVYYATVDAEICDGADYILPDGSIVTTTGVYITSLSSIDGCDSIITTNLTVHPVYTATVDAEICDGAEYILPDGSIATTTGVYITGLLSIEGCDSVITTNLTVHPVYTATVDAEICDGADYILPDGSIVTTTGVYVISLSSIDGCDSIITTNLIVHPVYTATVDAAICEGAEYILPDGSIATTTGVYITSLLSIEGCDSIITTNLIVHPVYTATVDAAICEGSDYILPDGSIATATGVYITGLLSIDGCDSVIATNLTVHPVYTATVDAEICDGADYILPDGSIATTTGVYVTGLSSIEGCDSIITTNLTVHPVYTATVDAEICDGADYVLPDGSIVTTTGVYVISLLSIEGCDSIITTNLTVNPVYTATIDAAICEGSDYILPDGSIATATGVYITSLLSIEGCDSVITTNLTVHPVYTATVDAEICDGADYILPDGSIATSTGVYVISLLSIEGCDSIITTNLTVHPVYAATVDAEICDGADYILPDGSIVTTSGVYVTSLSSIEGCDSIITTNLTVHPVYAATFDAAICEGSDYILPDGSIVTTTGVYVINLLSIDGCDSIITTNLTVHPVYAATVDAAICEGSDYILPDGSIATTTGVYVTSLSSIEGCDSVITTNLTVHPVYAATVDAEICDGADYTLPDGSIATTTGVYVTSLLSIEGCDSVITTNLTVHPVYAATVDAEICDGAEYILPDGSIATTSGVYVTNLLTVNGCDSIITTNLSVGVAYSETIDASICDGEEYILPDGTIATTGGVFITDLPGVDGCDSIITTNLSVHPVYAVTVDAEICDGAEYILPDGSIVTTSGVYITNLLSIDGCDSIITTNLTVHPVYTATVDAEICDGAEYILPDGSIATATGVYITSLSSIEGCDSIITTNLTVHPVYAATVDAEICDGAEYILPDGSIATTTGVYVTSLLSIDGCDSVITTNLTVHPVYAATVDTAICEGSDYILPDGSIVTTSGVYITNLSSIDGCDSIITTNLTVHPVDQVEVFVEICFGEEYLLPDGSSTGSPGEYVFVFSNTMGCDSTVTVTVSIDPDCDETELYDQTEVGVDSLPNLNGINCDSLDSQPVVDIANDTLFVYLGEQVELYANVYGGLTPLSFQWEPAEMVECPTCLTTNTIVNQTIILTFTATDTLGCKSSDEIILRLLPCDESLFEIPNIISPNGDGFNDDFYINYEGGLAIKKLTLYNRWGEVMFETKDLAQHWDGTFNGKLCNPGVYIYTVDFICSDGTLSLISGNITLVK